MSLLDEARAHRPARVACSFVGIYAALNDEDSTGLRDALADPQVMGSAIAAALTRRGFRITGITVQRHRRGVCGCE